MPSMPGGTVYGLPVSGSTPHSARSPAGAMKRMKRRALSAPIFIHHVIGRHRAGTLRHLLAARGDDALVEQPGERLVEIEQAEIVQRHGEEARVDQVHGGVLAPADVLIHRHPVFHFGRIEGARVPHAASSSAGSTRRSP